MKLPETPDFTSNRRMLALALTITVGAWVVLAISEGNITASLGDTDDAMRLVLVRSLLNGQGWYDQLVTRLQPPLGIYMHWSRLLDGGLAGFVWLVERVTTPAWAELIVRFAWPLLWIAPVAIAGLAIARSLGGKLAVFCCACLMVTNTQLYVQFRPGRIDHHNIQITMAAIAVACAMAKAQRVRFAAWPGSPAALALPSASRRSLSTRSSARASRSRPRSTVMRPSPPAPTASRWSLRRWASFWRRRRPIAGGCRSATRWG